MKVSFLIAEEVRPEASSKVTVLGLFPGNIIILQNGMRPEGVPGDTPEGLERLTILVTINDAPEGIHKFRGRIIEPSGDLYKPEASLGEVTAKAGFSNSVVIEMKPFIVKKAGEFRLEFFVDEQMFTFPFEIRAERPLLSESI